MWTHVGPLALALLSYSFAHISGTSKHSPYLNLHSIFSLSVSYSCLCSGLCNAQRSPFLRFSLALLLSNISIFISRFLVTTSNIVIPLRSPHCNILIASDDTTATRKVEKLGKGRRKDKIKGKFVNLVDDDVSKGAWQILEFQKVRQRPFY